MSKESVREKRFFIFAFSQLSHRCGCISDSLSVSRFDLSVAFVFAESILIAGLKCLDSLIQTERGLLSLSLHQSIVEFKQINLIYNNNY